MERERGARRASSPARTSAGARGARGGCQCECALPQVDGVRERGGGRRLPAPRRAAHERERRSRSSSARGSTRQRRRRRALFGQRAVALCLRERERELGGQRARRSVALTGNALPSAQRTKPSPLPSIAGAPAPSAICSAASSGSATILDTRRARPAELARRTPRATRARRRRRARVRPESALTRRDAARPAAPRADLRARSSPPRRDVPGHGRQRDDGEAHLRGGEDDLHARAPPATSAGGHGRCAVHAPASSNSAHGIGGMGAALQRAARAASSSGEERLAQEGPVYSTTAWRSSASLDDLPDDHRPFAAGGAAQRPRPGEGRPSRASTSRRNSLLTSSESSPASVAPCGRPERKSGIVENGRCARRGDNAAWPSEDRFGTMAASTSGGAVLTLVGVPIGSADRNGSTRPSTGAVTPATARARRRGSAAHWRQGRARATRRTVVLGAVRPRAPRRRSNRRSRRLPPRGRRVARTAARYAPLGVVRAASPRSLMLRRPCASAIAPRISPFSSGIGGKVSAHGSPRYRASSASRRRTESAAPTARPPSRAPAPAPGRAGFRGAAPALLVGEYRCGDRRRERGQQHREDDRGARWSRRDFAPFIAARASARPFRRSRASVRRARRAAPRLRRARASARATCRLRRDRRCGIARCRRPARMQPARRLAAGRDAASRGRRSCRRATDNRCAAPRCRARARTRALHAKNAARHRHARRCCRPTRARCRPRREPDAARLAHVGFEPCEEAVEPAPAHGFRRQLRFAVGERGDGAVTEHGDEREDRERDQDLDQREAAPRSPVRFMVAPAARCIR